MKMHRDDARGAITALLKVVSTAVLELVVPVEEVKDNSTLGVITAWAVHPQDPERITQTYALRKHFSKTSHHGKTAFLYFLLDAQE
jgi:hypothetical protein